MTRDAGRSGMWTALLVLGTAAATLAGEVEFTVEAGPHERRDTPVVVALPDSVDISSGVHLTDLERGRAVAAQVLPGTPARLAWILRGTLPAGSGVTPKRRLRLYSVRPMARV